ncbi:STAS domain-containing protein [Cellulomonas endophytica]|uniref:STAS domain-containing protein n=1 Tax=Cellulomonas endophytica TaxID=2494735 RepID=UPI001013525D|nr:STAS domain-containing protein [Cellulomonas endophytica]
MTQGAPAPRRWTSSTGTAALEGGPDGVRVVLSGEVDGALATEALPDLVARVGQGSGPLVVDVTGSTFLDSQGIALLVHVVRAAPGDARVLATEDARLLLELVGLERVVPVEYHGPGDERRPAG